MRIGWREREIGEGTKLGRRRVIVPVDAETGEEIEGVVECSVRCAVDEASTVTMTVFAHEVKGVDGPAAESPAAISVCERHDDGAETLLAAPTVISDRNGEMEIRGPLTAEGVARLQAARDRDCALDLVVRLGKEVRLAAGRYWTVGFLPDGPGEYQVRLEMVEAD